MTDLPKTLAEIAEIVGDEAAGIIAAHFGGGRLYMPKRLRPDHPLVVAIGAEPARALAAYFAGSQLAIPHGPNSQRRRVQDEVDALLAAGKTVAEIANTTGVDARTVQRRRARRRAHRRA